MQKAFILYYYNPNKEVILEVNILNYIIGKILF